MIVVMGHVNPDTDSVASAIIEAERLSRSGSAAQAFISGTPTKEISELLRHLHLPLPSCWQPTFADQPTVLVDFNDLEQAPGKLGNIIGVIDHHHDCGDLAQVGDKLIAPVGSTATLIARRFLADQASALTRQDCFLLLAAIISDTKNLLSRQTTSEDKLMAGHLANRCGISTGQIARQLQEWGCYHYAPELVTEYMTQSMKCNTINGHLVCSASIETLSLQPFLSNKQQIDPAVQLLAGEIKALIVTDLRDRQTAIFHNGVLPLASPHVMNGIRSRKQEIRLLLEQHLH